MRFSFILWFLTTKLTKAFKTNESLRKIISARDLAFVIKTKDDKRGKRYVFNNGEFYADDDLNNYDMAFIWRNSAVAFKTLSSKDDTAIQKAINDWDLHLGGDPNLLTLFGLILNVAMGKWKRE